MCWSVELTAYHETGHAVAAFALRRPVNGVSIVPDTKSNGRLVNYKLPDTFRPDANNDTRTRWLVEGDVMIFLAGGIFRRRFGGTGRHSATARTCVSLLTWPGTSAATWRRAAPTSPGCARTKLLLNQPWNWRAVGDLARALLEHKELSGRAVRRIYQAVVDTYGQDAAERAAMDAAVGWGR
jgi:hypothetical protein